MANLIEINTDRLRLRQWRAADREPFAALNADPAVMAHFPALLSRADSDALAQRCENLIAERGWGFWAAERLDSRQFIGFVGLHTPSPALPFSPCVEIGWRLAVPHWGQGFATEAARAALRVGFARLGLREIVSFTPLGNLKSRAVMERIGMCDKHQPFEHPMVPVGHELRTHCLYVITREQWQAHDEI